MRSVRWMSWLLCLGLAFPLAGCSLATAVDRDLIEPAGETGAEGSLAALTANRISGWAHIKGQAEPVQVRIEINGAVEDTVLADDMRQDLVDQGLHPTGEAGFSLTLSTPLQTGDVVSAFVVGKEAELANSPRTF